MLLDISAMRDADGKKGNSTRARRRSTKSMAKPKAGSAVADPDALLWHLAKNPALYREVQQSIWRLDFISADSEGRREMLKGFAISEAYGKPLVDEDYVLSITAWLPPGERFALRAYYYGTGADALKEQAKSEMLGASPFGFIVGFGEGILDAVVSLGKTLYGTGKALGHLIAFDPSGAWNTLRETYGPIGRGLANLFSGELWSELYRLAQEDPLAFNRALGNLGGEIFGAYTMVQASGQYLAPAAKAGIITERTMRMFEWLSVVQDWGINIPTSLDPNRQ
jgi:hypothetical protein